MAAIKDKFGENLTVNGSAGAYVAYSFRKGYDGVLIEPQAAVRYAYGPRAHIWLYDASATPKWVNLTTALTNRHVAGDSGASLDSLTTSDFVYIGAPRAFPGYYVDMDAASVNANAAVVACTYYNTAAAWGALTETDGTASGGKMLAQDGVLTYTLPTDWLPVSLASALSDTVAPNDRLFWLRFATGAALSADVEIEQIALLPTYVANMGYGKANVEYVEDLSGESGSLVAIAQGAGGTSLNVSWLLR